MSPSRVWPHLRAALITFHIVAVVVAAFPAPDGGMDRRSWSDPTVQLEFAQWAPWFRTTPERFEQRVFELGTEYMAARAHVLAPFQPYYSYSGVQQPWRLFVAPHRFPSRYQVQYAVRSGGGEWLTAFEERSNTSTWRAGFFEQERIRSAIFRFAWPAFEGDSYRFCTYVAALRFDDDPATTAVRCRFYTAQSPSAAEVRAGAIPRGNWTQSFTVERPLPGAT